MSQRVTRSSARLSAGSSISPTSPTAQTSPADPVQGLASAGSTSASTHPSTGSRKRKAISTSPRQPEEASEAQPRRRAKRSKLDPSPPDPVPSNDPSSSSSPIARRRGKGRAAAAMSSAGYEAEPSAASSLRDADGGRTPGGPSEDTGSRNQVGSSKRKDKKKNRPSSGDSAPRSTSSRRSKKGTKHQDDLQLGAENDDAESGPGRPEAEEEDHDDEGEGRTSSLPQDEDEEEDHPFGAGFLGRHHGLAGMSSTLRALTGMMSGVSGRLRGVLDNLKQKDDPTIQLIALQELSEVLLVSNEDNLTGHFHPDQYVKELVALMQPNELTGEENQDIMLLACRCLANLMEALPASTASVVYGGAVPVLCQKLLEINYIDLAEQALSTLERISVEFPSAIVREGGLTACLTYLDFFPTSTQRTAVTTAANCCRNIPEDSFGTVRDVMPILLNVLSNSDQRVLEQGCLCVSRIVESFKYQDKKLEELISEDMLRAILRLLIPGTTNLIGQSIHTQFLRVLSIIARASAKRSAELFKLNVVDTLYQILTGVSSPSGTDGVKTDSVVVMQALIHRPREQIFEALNVVCELLPSVQKDGMTFLDEIFDGGLPWPNDVHLSRSKVAPNDQKLALLQSCHEEVRRFTVILLPTLTDAFSSTVNLSVRQKVLTAQLKMLSNLDVDILTEALRSVPYASFLASILSQQDHPSLVSFALQAAELLLKRLESVYRYQFYREGVISEITKLAERPCKIADDKTSKLKPAAAGSNDSQLQLSHSQQSNDSSFDIDLERSDPAEADGDEDSEQDDEENDENEHHEHSDSGSDSSEENHLVPAPPDMPNLDDLITLQAKHFLDVQVGKRSQSVGVKASNTLDELRHLAQDIRNACIDKDHDSDSEDLFRRLAEYFDSDALESITSYELLTSDIVQVLLEAFAGEAQARNAKDPRSAFLQAFMASGSEKRKRRSLATTSATPFSILVKKLQDLLSRSEHFEVITVYQNAFETNRSSAASMLTKQLRLKLMADDDSGIPAPYRNIMVSIHAIANFKALDDYLRPRISLAERRPLRSKEGVASAMAAYAAAFGDRDTENRRLPIPPLVGLPGDLSSRKRGSRRSMPPAAVAAAAATAPSPPLSSATSTPGGKDHSRKGQRQLKALQSVKPPAPSAANENGETLECADEAQLMDEEGLDDETALDAIVGSLDEEMAEDEEDPMAVNMEVASTGKVTARKEDGTRIATPLGGALAPKPSLAPRPNPTQELLSTPTATASRAMSYAAAIQAVPQDWHLEFSVNDQPISNETTIYRAVHLNQVQPSELPIRNIWQPVHNIKFKRVPGPPPDSPTLSPPPETVPPQSSGLPASLSQHPTTSMILRLLSILHGLNANIDDIIPENLPAMKLNTEPLSQFVNTKLTAKLNRQLEEPLIVASNCLPSWSEDLARLYPFLFPFETRHLFLQSTSFGYSRSMTRWQSAHEASGSDSRHRHRDERPFLGRLQRQKVRISRNRILESAIKVMELYGSSASILEVEYFEEVGTGLGPTLEFYSSVSREFSKKKLKLWRENESADSGKYAFGKRGLFPAPMSEAQLESENGKKILHLFRVLGKFVARSMLDSRIIDVSFNPTFFRIANDDSGVAPSLGAIRDVDKDLANSLKLVKRFVTARHQIDEDPKLSPAQKVAAIQGIEVDGTKIDDLALDFTLPGYPQIELGAGGANTGVTIDNVGKYFDAVLDLTLGSGVARQVESFKEGFGQVFPYAAVRAFTPAELVMLFGRTDEDWSLETLMDSIKADHGFNLDSRSVKNLLTIMSEMNAHQRREYLQFITGSPKLPIGGFKALTPMFTVVCKPSETPYTSDDYLPSVMTCVNYLKLPDYSSLDVMRKKLGVAVREGQGAFHLS